MPDPQVPVLRVEGLRIGFGSRQAVKGISFDVAAGETVALVGESGSGKSVTALSIMRLLPETSTISGAISLAGTDMLGLRGEALRSARGRLAGMIFQEPMTSLNPVLKTGFQVAEALRYHGVASQKAAEAEALRLFDRVRIPDAKRRFSDYPHTLSGGMRQRVMIAMALACKPKLLIADEPTTALDVTIQAQILELMRRLREETQAAIILITHDLGVVAEVCDEVAVMYAGQIVERAAVQDLFAFPQHPYTVGLLGALPRFDAEQDELAVISGSVPDLSRRPTGCRFRSRCPFRIERCEEMPPLIPVENGRLTRCWRAPLQRLVA